MAITVLGNRTAHSFLQSTITNALVDEFSRRRPNLIVSVEQAQAVLSGTIQRLESETVTRANSQTASQRRLVIYVSLSMTDKAGNLLWQQTDMRVEQNYTVSSIKTASDQNRRRAMEKAALRLAENVYERLTSSF
jgi:hypothetical protein